MLFVRRHWAFGFWHYRYYYNYHDHTYVEHDSPDERSPEDRTVVYIDWRFNAVVIFRVKVSSMASVNGSKLWLLTLLVNYVATVLVVCQLSRDVIGYEESREPTDEIAESPHLKR